MNNLKYDQTTGTLTIRGLEKIDFNDIYTYGDILDELDALCPDYLMVKELVSPDMVEIHGSESIVGEKSSVGKCFFPNLISIDMPALKVAGESVFARCRQLTQANLPSLERCKHSAFAGCKSLRKIDFPNLKEVGIAGFNSCTGAEEINLPELVKCDKCAFKFCTTAREIFVPKLKTPMSQAFCDCYLVAKFCFPRQNDNFQIAIDKQNTLRYMHLCRSQIVLTSTKPKHSHFEEIEDITSPRQFNEALGNLDYYANFTRKKCDEF